VKNWAEVLEKFLGLGFHPGEESEMNGHVFSAGESLNVFTPHNDANDPLVFDKSNALGEIEPGSEPCHGRDLLLLHTR
jgi:hypothetical protein